LALAIGLIVGRWLQPGKGFDTDPSTLDPNAVATYVSRAKQEGIVSHLLAIIPDTFIGAFAKGDLLQVLLFAILTGFAISGMGELGTEWWAQPTPRRRCFSTSFASSSASPLSGPSGPWRSPSGPGIGALAKLGELTLTFYFTSALFVVVVHQLVGT
jgi:aerobic C4-dicarboxylate transport protein